MVNDTHKKVTPAKRGRPAKATTRGEHVTGNRPSTRIPLSGSRLRLHLDEKKLDPAFHYKWVNDVDDKMRRFREAGYEHVSADEGLEIGQRGIDNSDSELGSVVCRDVGKGVMAYLLKQPIEFYNEDKAAKEENTEQRAAALKQSLNSGQEGTYGKVDIS